MFRNIAMMNMPRNLLLIALVAISLVLPVATAGAQGGFAQAFAMVSGYQYRGTRVDIWTAQQPAGQNPGDFVASPSAICTRTDPDCAAGISGFFETGYVKGKVGPVQNQNQLQQYASYANIGDWVPTGQYGLGNLNDNSWYTFQTLYSNTAQRWEAWRNGQLIWYVPSSLNFQSGVQVGCGAEGNPNGITLGVECENMRYKAVGNNNWIQYDYTYTRTTQGPPKYCVFRRHQFNGVGWGPC